jgi:tRNA modification GTPase
MFYGTWNSTGEDVMLVQTDPTQVEIHCHGGESAVQSIVQTLEQHGFGVLETPQVYQLFHGNRWKTEFAQAAADAFTERAAELILRQYLQADDCLLELTQLIRVDSSAARERLSQSVRWSEFGLQLSRNWSVVFCGKPNVGKSSLLNTVVGFSRAIVHQTAGTTRDVVSQRTAIDGWPVEIKDTAGLRVADNLIERKGVELAQSEMEKADLVVIVLDATEVSKTNWEELPVGDRALVVVNKVDLLDGPESIECPAETIPTSAINGHGVEDLLQAISTRLVPELPPDGVLVPVHPAQLKRLYRCLELVTENQGSEAISCLSGENDPVD